MFVYIYIYIYVSGFAKRDHLGLYIKCHHGRKHANRSYFPYHLSFRALLTAEALVADKEEFALLRRL